MSARPTTRALAALAVALAVAISGCGGDDEEEPKEREPGAVIVKPPQEESELRTRFDELVGEVLAERGLDEATIECALDELGNAISDAEIETATDEIRETGLPPPGVIEAATAAGAACGGE